MADVDGLIAELHRAPRSGADALIQALGLGSQPTFSRLVARAGDRIVAIGQARARRYVAAREIPGLGREVPVYRIDASGHVAPAVPLKPVEPAGFVVDGSFAETPPFLDAMRPDGFLGAVLAKRVAALGLPDDPRAWTDDQALLAMATAGEDLPGDLVVGDESARRYYAWRAGEVETIARDARPKRYAALADEAIRGVVPGPVVAGEQPKFGAVVATGSGPAHVLVKFSPSEYSPVARRWCDLLVCEHLALEALRTHGVPTVASEILEGGSRVFLETTRFDRVGLYGRRTLGPAPASNELAAFARFLDDTDAAKRRPGPVHGLLPMGYAPVGGELPSRDYVPPPPAPGGEDAWRTAGAWAVDFWQRVAVEDRVSRAFRTIARENTLAIMRLLARFGGRA